VGYVLEGNFGTDYDGEFEHYEAGDLVFIPKGEKDRHKAVLGKGERVLLLLFEVD
jgi:quercetin dioxygenase-like cupin family protein